ncbi:MAG: acetylornithine transaminase [Myxococcota bacterium]
MKLADTARQVLAPTYRQPDPILTRGEGCWVWDEDDNAYLDMTTGIAVTSLGHGAPVVREALIEAANGLTHTSNLYFTRPAIELATALVEHSFADRVFFCNSGTESVEGAIKFARLAAGDRRDIVYFDGAFHGRTFGALAATDREASRRPFEPLPGGFRRAPFDDDIALTMIDESVAAVMVEPLQGEGGVRVPRPEWLRALRTRCDEVGALLIADEIQCGLSRTGRLWAHEHADIQPDIMTLAKPLAGGLPMGAILLGPRVVDAISPGVHGSTFGGGPLVAKVALAVFHALRDPELLAGVQPRADLLRKALLEALGNDLIEVRGVGLLMGVALRLDHPGRAMARAAFEEGLLLAAASGNVLRILPPLNAPEADLLEAVDRLARTVRRLKG